MRPVGTVYVNASLALLEQGPSSGTLFFNLYVDFPTVSFRIVS
jgi:acid phosphatase